MQFQQNRGLHETISEDLLAIVIHKLNQVLLGNGVSDTTQRRSICEGFAESFGDFVDQGWFESVATEGKRYYPLLCYATRGPWTDMDAGQIIDVVVPSPTSFFYESFSETCEWYFDEHSEIIDHTIKTGSC